MFIPFHIGIMWAVGTMGMVSHILKSEGNIGDLEVIWALWGMCTKVIFYEPKKWILKNLAKCGKKELLKIPYAIF